MPEQNVMWDAEFFCKNCGEQQQKEEELKEEESNNSFFLSDLNTFEKL